MTSPTSATTFNPSNLEPIATPQNKPADRSSTGDESNPIQLNLETLWPYSKDQTLKLNAILDRLRGSKNLIENVIDFFKTIAHIEEDAGKDYKKSLRAFKSLPATTDSSELPFIDDSQYAPGLNGIFASVHAIGNHHLEIAQHIRESTIKGLESIYTTHHRKIKDIKSNILKQSTWITKSRQDTLQTICTHVKTQSSLNHTSKLRGSSATTSRDLQIVHDPWLTEIAIHMGLKTNLARENTFQTSMLALIELAKVTESQSIASILQIIHEHLNSRTVKQNNLQSVLTGLIAIINKFDTARPMSTFCDSQQLVKSPCWQTFRNFHSFPYHMELKDVCASICFQGQLFRQGTIRKSKWKPAWFVLTEFGFMHCFDDSCSPFSEVTNNNQDPQNLDLEQTCAKLPVILFSICLRTQTTVLHLPENKPNQENQFEIVCVSNHNHSMLHLGKKEIRYMLKAASEESMVDWVCSIRRIVSVYAPTQVQSPATSNDTNLELIIPLPESPMIMSVVNDEHSSSPMSLSNHSSNLSVSNTNDSPASSRPKQPSQVDLRSSAASLPQKLPPSPASLAAAAHNAALHQSHSTDHSLHASPSLTIVPDINAKDVGAADAHSTSLSDLNKIGNQDFDTANGHQV